MLKNCFFLLLIVCSVLLPGMATGDTLTLDTSQNSIDSSYFAEEAKPDTSKLAENVGKQLVYKLNIKEEIGPSIWRQTQQAFESAYELDADAVLIHMNTYGGLVIHADSIRTKIMQSKIPVYVFIDNNAASAGALISIACDSIYMRAGANIGAATVVNQSAEAMPDKYQSYMRSTMRSTAEAKGRNPKIAEAMVDPSIYIEGVIDTGKVLTFTTSEAILHGFCEGQAESISEALKLAGIEEYDIEEYKPSKLEAIIGLLVNPAVSGILIMIILGGIYFELQTPGVGFPIAAAFIAAMLYFAPLYLEGLAENWEIVMFIAGLILIAVEVFAIPGFGVAGIAGIILAFTGLTLSLIGNVGFNFDFTGMGEITRALMTVMISFTLGIIVMFFLGKSLLESPMFKKIALTTTQNVEDGYVGVDMSENDFIGKEGTAYTDLRPAGKIMIDGEVHDATAQTGYIEKGEAIKVIKFATAQLLVMKV